MSWKTHFSKALAAAPARLHFAAHSHHLWPDVTWAAHRQAWNDAAALADHKWEAVFGDLLPSARGAVARRMGLPSGRSVVFAPNTHALVMRVLSCLPADRPLRVLTTASEFHSFRRQLDRLEEAGRAESVRMDVAPWSDAASRLAARAAEPGWDLVYFSQVFFDSGFALSDADLVAITHAVSDPATFVVIDGYHGFMARPTDLSEIAGRAFYLAGGYKYAMAGEGACWMHAPPGYGPRPVDTGWFAAFDALSEGGGGGTPYPPDDDASRFAGATFDPTSLHRFVAVQRWLEGAGIEVEDIRAHTRRLQARWLERCGPWADALAPADADAPRGAFLTFRTPKAAEVDDALRAAGVIVDHREDRLRVGFGMYQDDADVDAAAALLRREARA